jgi:hypothetical protein
MDNKYKTGKIYDITSNNTDMVYVGSCTKILKTRLYKHITTRTCSSKYIIDCGDYNINLIENYPCDSKKELRMREQYYINKYRNDGKNIVNIINAYTSEEDKKQYQKQWREENKDKKDAYLKNYRMNHREDAIEYQKQYRQENKDSLKVKRKFKRQKNILEIREYDKERYLFKSKRVCNAFYDFAMMLNEY